jgi:hypothetical protein
MKCTFDLQTAVEQQLRARGCDPSTVDWNTVIQIVLQLISLLFPTPAPTPPPAPAQKGGKP